MGPTFSVVKAPSSLPCYLFFCFLNCYLQVSCKNAHDLTTSRVLNGFFGEGKLCDPALGWEKHIWEGSVWVADTKNKETGGEFVIHRRPYLISHNDLECITVQNKAWMDSAGMVMRCELLLKPLLERSGYEYMLEVVDNCASHHNRSVVAAYQEAGWLFLTPNMTHLLQPMDVAVNGPVKSALRRMRISLQFEYFQAFRASYFKAKYKATALPKFAPPVPAIEDGLRTLLDFKTGLFASAHFRDNLAKTYIKVGLAKTTDHAGACEPHFLMYTDKTKGQLATGRGKNHGRKKKAGGSKERKEPTSLGVFGSDISLGGMLLDVMSRSECQ